MKMSFYKILFSLFIVFKFSCTSENSCSNPYENCNLGKPGMINVHMISHSHNDLGWVQTVDQYYSTFFWPVRSILDSSIIALNKDPNRRFIYVEIGFFWRWWNEQNEKTKEITRKLVKERRLEFTIGGWAMNDEATTYYRDTIDQHTLGFQFILKEFGECARPKVAWQIDPFGHSKEQGSQFTQFGFDGVFHGRIDYQEFDYRAKTLSREMIWKTSNNLGESSNLFTGILPRVYDPPSGFCFDTICGVQELSDTSRDNYNRINTFVDFVMNQTKDYKTNNLIMTMGADFQYSYAERWFINIDRLIKHVNERQATGSKINLFYSTPSCYLYSLYMSNTTWPTKDDDFFPYGSRDHTYWTGFFTSRPTLKYYVRQTSNFLQSVRHLAALTRQSDDNTKNALQTIGDAMGILQHHDAVSGTAQQHVTNDYAKLLSVGTDGCIEVIINSFKYIASRRLTNMNQKQTLNLHYCSLLNITECLPIENRASFTLTAYNPLGRTSEYWIRVPVTDTSYTVINLDTNELIKSEFTDIYKETKMLPERQASTQFELVFKSILPPLGLVSYSIQKKRRNVNKVENLKKEFQNSYLSLDFDSNGNLLKIENLETGVTAQVSQKFCYYKSFPGDNKPDTNQASGAYVFRPNGPETCFSVKEFSYKYGQQFSEIHQIYNDWISQTIRLYDDAKYIEFEWQVGPINIDDQVGKEVVNRFQTDLNSGGIFYTDSNGREIQKRIKDYRSAWPNFNQTEPVAGNYYPINSVIYIRDSSTDIQRQFSIVNDRSQGGTSLNDGMIEIMVHRRNLFDDAMGVNEPLNEEGTDGRGLISKGTHYVFLDSAINSARLHRDMAQKVNNRPLMIFGLPETNNDIDIIRSLGGLSALKSDLPNNVHILTLMKDYSVMEDNAIIVRFEHFYEKNEDSEYSLPVTINLVDLLSPAFEIIEIEELALGANMKVTELNDRLLFNGQKNNNKKTTLENPSSILLNPMQIRTFRIWFSKSLKSTLSMYESLHLSK